MAAIDLAFWNLENLFDTEDWPDRPDWMRQTLAKELEGWSPAVLGAKIERLVAVIAALGGGAGPDLLGVCEVESRGVLEKLNAALKVALPGRRYAIAHHDASDKRGIDVAFFHDTRRIKVTKQFFHVILKRESTRDLFQINAAVAGRPMVFIANHWPSRSGGRFESEPYRITAAETLAYWIERIHEELGDAVPVVVMGDFNDEPSDRSLRDYALAGNNADGVKAARNKALLNLMWPAHGAGEGTHYYQGRPNVLDQFLVNQAIVTGAAGWRVAADSVRITRVKAMTKGRKREPRRFGRPSAKTGYDPEGASDHFPIEMRLEEV